ncbi:MAG: nitrous oxide reductase accessory protein NosL [Haloferacaceae archaeon]
MSLTAGPFPYYFRHRDRGWTAVAIYVTDYSAVDYEVTTVEGTPYISSSTAAAAFGPATGLTYVAGSTVRGGMGKTLVPFSDPDDADSFVDDHGGRRVPFDDVTPTWLDAYLHEAR